MSKQIKIKDLIPDDANFNKGNQFGESLIEKSFDKFGAGRSILLDKNNKIIAGNKSTQKFVEQGGENVIIVETDGKTLVAVKRNDIDLDTKRGREMALADNATAKANIEWDFENLTEWEMPIEDWGIVPFETIKPEETENDAEAQIDKAEELNKIWQVKAGDLWAIGESLLLCGDSTKADDVERLTESANIKAVLTDPPYGQNQLGVTNDEPEKHFEILDGAIASMNFTDVIVVAFQSPRTFPVWLDALRAHGFNFERMLWLYKAAQCTFPWRGWILTSESILVATKGEASWQEVHPYSHDCYYLSEVSGELPKDSGWHGSVKPLSVVQDLLSRISAKGSDIYEPFAGSGTTLVACQNLGRKCYAIEISENYCAVILERMKNAFEGIEIKRINEIKTK